MNLCFPLCLFHFAYPTPPHHRTTTPCCPSTHACLFDCYLFGKYNIGIFFPDCYAANNVKKVAFADFQDVAMGESSTYKCKQSSINVRVCIWMCVCECVCVNSLLWHCFCNLSAQQCSSFHFCYLFVFLFL